ncbi:hypothetical protein BSKO_10577 [Bryopsis sp. KO-2023]|nr:hypothetical protein BSKO_10577 [Bryopsis sp. KO-2023]
MYETTEEDSVGVEKLKESEAAEMGSATTTTAKSVEPGAHVLEEVEGGKFSVGPDYFAFKRLPSSSRDIIQGWEIAGVAVDGNREDKAPGTKRKNFMFSRKPSPLETNLETVQMIERETDESHVTSTGYRWNDVARFQRRYCDQGKPEEIDLTNTLHGGARIKSLIEFLDRNKKIQKLRLGSNLLLDDDIPILVECMTKENACFSSLDLSGNKLTTAAGDALSPLFQPPGNAPQSYSLLTQLDLSNNPLGCKGLLSLANSLGSKVCPVVTLRLVKCCLGERSSSAIREMLARTKTLERFFLGWNVFGSKGGAEISAGMKENNTLKTLSVPFCGLGDKGSAALAVGLEENQMVEILDLSGNRAANEACTALARSLKTAERLKHLYLRNNPLGVEGSRKLLRGVTSGSSVHLHLGGCSFLSNVESGASSNFDVNRPAGRYRLDLSLAADNAIAKELVALAKDHGHESWRHASLDEIDLDVGLVVEGQWIVPSAGTLVLEFVWTRSPSQRDVPLTDPQLKQAWFEPTSDQNVEDLGEPLSDRWKLGLLSILCHDYFFTSRQVLRILNCFSYDSEKIDAAVMIFTRVMDLDQFHIVTESLRPAQEEIMLERLGVLSLFHSENPTGRYDLMLIQQSHHLVASRLMDIFARQLDNGLCDLPTVTCCTTFRLNGKDVPVKDTHSMDLPRKGRLQVDFCDLRPIPESAKALSSNRFNLLLSMLTTETAPEPKKLVDVMMDTNLEGSLIVLSLFSTWKFGKATRHGLPGFVKYPMSALTALKALADHTFFKCSQVKQILAALTGSEPSIRLEVASLFWGRAIDRDENWTSVVVQPLPPEEQIELCQRLGYLNIFNPKKPAMHYLLRMNRPDEYQVALQLFNMAMTATHKCYRKLLVDGVERRARQNDSLWSVMTDNAREGSTPKAVVEFEYLWPGERKLNYSATVVQRACREFQKRTKEKSGH